MRLTNKMTGLRSTNTTATTSSVAWRVGQVCGNALVKRSPQLPPPRTYGGIVIDQCQNRENAPPLWGLFFTIHLRYDITVYLIYVVKHCQKTHPVGQNICSGFLSTTMSRGWGGGCIWLVHNTHNSTCQVAAPKLGQKCCTTRNSVAF